MQQSITINIRGQLMDFAVPKVMGIINVTPDSFYSESRAASAREVQRVARRMINQGADFLDVGACSTRPGAILISEDEEMRRLEPALEAIRKRWPKIPLSVDTFRSGVARRCVRDWEVDVINDVSGGSLDRHMHETVAELQVTYVLMHLRGTPEDMHLHTSYSDITAEVLSEIVFKIAHLNSLGIRDIIIDPGFGLFAKTLEQNYALLDEIEFLRQLELPLMAGVSRKSMVYKVLDTTPEKALNGTTVLNTLALRNGADILRVHDVAEARQAVAIISHSNYKRPLPRT